MNPSNFSARFMTYVDSTSDDACWNWKGATRDGRYGAFRMGSKTINAHRAAHEIFIGPIPEGMCVLHSCDNKQCVNPKHISLGSQEQNMRESSERCRHLHGEAHPKAKMDESKVKLLRLLDWPSRELAKVFGIHQTTVCDIKRGSLWNKGAAL